MYSPSTHMSQTRCSSDTSVGEIDGMLPYHGHNVDEKETSRRRRTGPMFTFAMGFSVLLSIVSLALAISMWPKLTSASPSSETRGDPYRPSTLLPGLNTCDCGTTVQQALERSCIYDSLAAAWLPPYCRDDELTTEFEHSNHADSEGKWHYFADEQGTIALDKTQLGLLGESGGSFWTSREWHIAHCLFYWQKYTRVRDTGVIMEERFDSLAHVKHCTHLATKKNPGFFFLIDVAVRMNSSADIPQ